MLNDSAHDGFLRDLQGNFINESSQLLDRITENLAFLDHWIRGLDEQPPQHCETELLNDMFRAVHSIKGLSTMVGLGDINRLTEKLESIIGAARAGTVEMTPETVEVLFDALSVLTGHIDQVRGPHSQRFDDSQILERIERLLPSATVQPGGSQPATATASPNAVPPCESSKPHAEEYDPLEGVADDVEIASKFLPIFIDEAGQVVDQLTETLLELEIRPRPELVERLLVLSHRLKGSAASLGLNRCAKLAHEMEDVLQALQETEATPTCPVVEALLHCGDALRMFVTGLRYGRRDDALFSTALRELQSSFSQGTTGSLDEHQCDPSPPLTPIAPPEERSFSSDHAADSELSQDTDAASNAITGASRSDLSAKLDEHAQEACGDWTEPIVALLPPGLSAVAGRAWFPADLPLPGLKASLILERLGSLGKVFYSRPTVDELDRANELECFDFGLLTPASAQTIGSRLKLGGVTKVELVPITREAETSPGADAPGAASTGAPPTSSPSAGVPMDAAAVASPPEEATSSSEAVFNDSPDEIPSTTVHQPEPPPVETVACETSVPGAAPLQNVASNEDCTASAATVPAAVRTSKPVETLRVEINRLDQLMNLAGQLAIQTARIGQLSQSLRGRLGGKRRTSLRSVREMLKRLIETAQRQRAPGGTAGDQAHYARRLQSELQDVEAELETLFAVRQLAGELHDAIHQLDRVSGSIQQNVMETRMVPIGPLFNRFRRVVRDLTRITGKQIRLEIRGEKTKLDKRMIDELSDPLLHLVRNCSDHGIEPPSERIRAGKPAEGIISFNAYHRGNSIVIEVKDDGHGINVERIRAKVAQRGLASLTEVQQFTPQQLWQYTWEPGFSTAAEITEISGRGIGMDIVRAKVEELSGTVSIESQEGRGTTFTIRLPLTLAIVPCLLIEIEGQPFALPMEWVQEIVARSPGQMMTIHGQWATLVRERVVAAVELHDLFDQSGTSQRNHTPEVQQDALLVLLGESGNELGLRVDRLLGEADVVVQSLAVNYRPVPGISGTSILGDGRVALILDVNALVEAMAARSTRRNQGT